MKLNERELEILNAMVDAWQDADAPIPGGISYQEVIDWLEKMGANRPEKLIQRINELEQLAALDWIKKGIK